MPYDETRAATYDQAHAHQFAEADVVADALAALNAQAGAGPVLELGVGTGRLALPLAARGLEVWGIDNSDAMLDRLRAKPGADRIHVVTGDFSDAGTLVKPGFTLAVVAFNTLFELPSQEAQLRCLDGVAGLLVTGGLLVVEALAPDLTRLEQTVSALSVGPDRAVLQATRHDPVTQVVAGADFSVTDGQVHLSPWSIRYVSVPELDLMARLAGLSRRHRWGGWHREPFTASSSTHVSVYER
ncbi:MAG: class I SAM-dependent methyltransferase [Acidimicrobiales bacterium]